MALQAFSKIDIDGSGALSKDELKKALDHMGKNMTDQELDDFIAKVDDDGAGLIEFNEFLEMLVTI